MGKNSSNKRKKRSNNNVIGKINYYSAAKRNQSVEKNKRNTKKVLDISGNSLENYICYLISKYFKLVEISVQCMLCNRN